MSFQRGLVGERESIGGGIISIDHVKRFQEA